MAQACNNIATTTPALLFLYTQLAPSKHPQFLGRKKKKKLSQLQLLLLKFWIGLPVIVPPERMSQTAATTAIAASAAPSKPPPLYPRTLPKHLPLKDSNPALIVPDDLRIAFVDYTPEDARLGSLGIPFQLGSYPRLHSVGPHELPDDYMLVSCHFTFSPDVHSCTYTHFCRSLKLLRVLYRVLLSKLVSFSCRF